MHTSSASAYASTTFKVQLLITMVINFGINLGWEWWAMSASFHSRAIAAPTLFAPRPR